MSDSLKELRDHLEDCCCQDPVWHEITMNILKNVDLDFMQLQAIAEKQGHTLKALCELFNLQESELLVRIFEDLKAENKQLQAENEKLKKAGNFLYQQFNDLGRITPPTLDEWCPSQEYKETVLKVWSEALTGD